MKITTETKFMFREVELNKTYEIDFGTLKRGSDTLVEILFEGADHLKTSKSCGCTMPEVEIQGHLLFTLKIKYDNQKTGSINQYVKEKVLDNATGEETVVKIDLKGKIV